MMRFGAGAVPGAGTRGRGMRTLNEAGGNMSHAGCPALDRNRTIMARRNTSCAVAIYTIML
jgi:hypothetical protein